MQNFMFKKVYAKPTGSYKGTGLFAEEPIRKRESTTF